MSEVKLTKSIPLSIFLGILFQLGVTVWFIAMTRADVTRNTSDINERKVWEQQREVESKVMNKEIITLTATVKQLVKTTDALNESVKKLTERVNLLH